MSTSVFLVIYFIIICVGLVYHFEPKLDIISGKNGYRVLLWYNTWKFDGIEYKRSYIELFQIKTL